MPIISVIIPTYNREKFVVKAIDSVLIQTFKDYEIIVIDDGSTDNTQQALESYKDKIQYIYQNNQGVSAARNAGILRAKGEWIAFLDSDDEWLPGYLSYQIEGVRQNQQLCASLTNSLVVTDNGIENHFEKFKFMPKFKADLYITLQRPLCSVVRYELFRLQTIIIKRKVLLKIDLFNVNLSFAEDYELISRLALQGPFGVCKQPLAHIHRRHESIQHLSGQSASQGIYESMMSISDSLRKSKNLTFWEKEMLLSGMSSNRRALANLLLRQGKKEEATIYYRKAFFIYPSIKSLLKYLLSLFPPIVALRFIRKGKNVEP